ncbi:hypothetical protein [Deinococcus radiotolerans]|uniref:Uncharacterized protein n=1 Tax=Deinococcus radiotolerans TaxID=1309407 RepID=A0ABQ2FIQ1_9DEIO|nr:hypothetical protein [Deinococcus radiotolerans]GGK91102.1 hypothetical protein GCM10010844_07070 [Deinococcus radiotolerans]
MTSSPAQGDDPFATLTNSLLQALLPLALSPDWHPVRSLGTAPDLPENWWTIITDLLNLPVQADGGIHVPRHILEVLERRYQQAQPARYRDHISQVSAALAQEGNIVHSAALLARAGAQDLLDRRLEEWISDRHHLGEHDAIQDVVRSIPADWLGPRAEAAYWLNQVVASREDSGAARQNLQRAYDRGDRNPRLLQALSYSLHADGQYLLALRVARQGTALQPQGLDRLRLMHQINMCLDCLNLDEEHLTAAEAMLSEATTQVNLSYMGLAHATLAYAHENLQHWPRAEYHFQQAADLYRRTSQWRFLAVLLNNYAGALGDQGHLVEARQYLNDAEQLPHLSDRHRAWIAMSKATLHHRYSQPAETRSAVRQATLLLQDLQMSADEATVHLMTAERLAFDAQFEEADETLRRARNMLGHDPDGEAHVAFSTGVIAYARQNWSDAATQFHAALDGSLDNWNQVRAHLYLIAIAFNTSGQPELTHLERALASLGHDAPLQTDTALLTPTLTWLAQQPGWTARIQQVFTLGSAGSIVLRLELYGDVEAYRQTQLLSFPLRRSTELLAYLALTGPSTRKQIMAALWEEAMGPKVIDRFKKTLRSLRTALSAHLPEGSDPVIVQNGRYRLNPLFTVTVSWLPDQLFAAPDLLQTGQLDIRGVFLADATGPWAEDLRPEVHEHLYRHLTARLAAGDPTVHKALILLRPQI